MRKWTIIILLFAFCSCETPTKFSEAAQQEILLNWEEEEVAFQNIIHQYKGKKVLIDIWASWCADCIVGLPNLKRFQEEHPEVVYVFLSLDRTVESWKRAVTRLEISGEHYFMKAGKKGELGDFLNLWWIPRYVVLNELGEITLFKATKITDEKIVEALKK
jgi:thiol-disulfide isomerase/thioredoxin